MNVSGDSCSRKPHNWTGYHLANQWLTCCTDYSVDSVSGLGSDEMPYKIWPLNYVDQSLGLTRCPRPILMIMTQLIPGNWAVYQRIGLWSVQYWLAQGETASEFAMATKKIIVPQST